MFLIDTNVISELKRRRPHGAVVAWLKSVPATDLRISAMTIGEIQAGIEITREQDAAKAREIETWLEQIIGSYQVLVIDSEVMRTWARLMHNKSSDLYEDAIIAATALVYGLTIVTPNTRDFKGFGTKVLDPFAQKVKD
jgi:toxin FitB